MAYRDGRKAYADAPPPRFLVTLLGGDHSSLYDPFDGPPAQVTARVTLDFFDGRYLFNSTRSRWTGALTGVTAPTDGATFLMARTVGTTTP